MKICDLVPRELTGFKFHIKTENILPAFEVAKETCDELSDMKNITKMFSRFGFSSKKGKNGIDRLEFDPSVEFETIDLINFFEVIAPFVEAGSFIKMMGTEGGAWRWIFNGKEVIGQLPADYIWPSQPLSERQGFEFYQWSRLNNYENTKHFCKFTDEVMFGIRDDNGETTCELFVRWYELGGKSSPKFELFLDSLLPMQAHTLLRIIQSAMDYGDELTPEDFCKCLKWFGFKDLFDKPLE